MEWITGLFSQVWLDVALLALAGAGGAVLLAPRRVPRIGAGPPLQEITTPRLEEVAGELHVIGFRYHGTLEYERGKREEMALSAHLSSDQLELAFLAAPERDGGRVVIEILSTFEPFGSVLTTNSARGVALSGHGPPRADRIVVRAPWKSHVEELLELHRDLCETAEESGLFRVPLPDDAIGDVAREELLRDYEMQVAKGTMKRRGVRCYRLTMKGALVLLPRTGAARLRGLFGRRRRGDRELCERVGEAVRRCLELPASARNRWPERLWTRDEVNP